MKIPAATVDAYLAQVPATRLAALTRLRALCLETLPGCEESIDYGMPCYKRNGVLEVSFASQKQYVALYVLKAAVVETFRDRLSASSIGKSCIRFTNPARMDFAVLRQLLLACAASTETPC